MRKPFSKSEYMEDHVLSGKSSEMDVGDEPDSSGELEEGKTKRSSGEAARKKSGNSILILKIVFFVVLLGAVGLGGFWGFVKVRQGMEADKAIGHLETRIAALASGQANIQRAIGSLEIELGQIKQSQRILSQVPVAVDDLGKKLAVMGEMLSGISRDMADLKEASARKLLENPMDSAPSRMISSAAETPADPAILNPPGFNSEGINAAPEHNESAGNENMPLEKFMKPLLSGMGQGISWVFEKLKWAFSEIWEYSKGYYEGR